jgi:nickel transport protein
MFKTIVSAVFLMFAIIHPASAHDAWIGNRDGTLVILYGHGGKTEAYNPDGVQAAKAFDAKGQDVAVEIVKGKDEVTLSPKEKPAFVAAIYEGGYFVKTTDGWKKMKKTEAKGKFDVVEAVKSRKCCKSFLSAGDAYGKQVGQFFEIVPQKDPATVKSGDTLPVKVFLEGKPFEGAVVATGGDHAADSKDAVKTDKDGMASVKIEKSGPQLVKANDKISVKGDPDADVMYLSSTITFDAQ